jgi:hypothetical protein
MSWCLVRHRDTKKLQRINNNFPGIRENDEAHKHCAAEVISSDCMRKYG